MFARIENNQVIEWDLFEGELEKRFPNLKWPMSQHPETTLPDGYVDVKVVQPAPNPRVKHVRIKPQLIDGVWTEVYSEINCTDVEVAQALAGMSLRARQDRDIMLQKSDIYVMSDRWETYSPSLKEEWTTYRQELRDITKLPGFPENITWPVNPMVFRIRPIADTI